jgi:3'-phosphoadenosine 5'-phosphosulfate sulfotransferase
LKERKSIDTYLYFSFVLETRCHARIRCVLNFVSEVLGNLEDGMAKITLSIKLSRKLIWIAEEKVNRI